MKILEVRHQVGTKWDQVGTKMRPSDQNKKRTQEGYPIGSGGRSEGYPIGSGPPRDGVPLLGAVSKKSLFSLLGLKPKMLIFQRL